MKVEELELSGLLHIQPDKFGDDRGFFMETWSRDRYEKHGMHLPFVQDNMSWSNRGVLRGMHFQNPKSQGKLVYVLLGEVYDVNVDLRKGSPTFGKWAGVTLSDKLANQLYVPPGFAHGFCVVSERALFCYKCTDFYSPSTDRGLAWNDREVGIRWPVSEPIVSPKDQKLLNLRDLPREWLLDFDASNSRQS